MCYKHCLVCAQDPYLFKPNDNSCSSYITLTYSFNLETSWISLSRCATFECTLLVSLLWTLSVAVCYEESLWKSHNSLSLKKPFRNICPQKPLSLCLTLPGSTITFASPIVQYFLYKLLVDKDLSIASMPWRYLNTLPITRNWFSPIWPSSISSTKYHSHSCG